jgi:hypothetical protein
VRSQRGIILGSWFAVRLLTTLELNSLFHWPATVLRCIHYLTDVSWEDIGYPNFDAPADHPCQRDVPQSFQAVIIGYISAGFSPSNLVLYRLWERAKYIEEHNKFESILKPFLENHNAEEARELAFDAYVQQAWEPQAHTGAYSRTIEGIACAARHILRRGARWVALINAVESSEVVLADEDRHLLDGSTTISRVIQQDAEDEFEKVKEFLCSPENNFKESCLRLSGLQDMIHKLADTPKGTDLRAYLQDTVRSRIEDLFGPAGRVVDDPLEDITKIEITDLTFDINTIFGIHIGVTDEPPRRVIPGSSPAGM